MPQDITSLFSLYRLDQFLLLAMYQQYSFCIS